MKVLMLQTDIKWLSPRDNLIRAEKLIRSAIGEYSHPNEASPDMIVLPEMFPTGFVTSGALDAAEPPEGPTFRWMRQISERYDAAVVGTVATAEQNGKLHNRLYFVRPDGTYVSYDKRHLFSYAGEDREYLAGEQRVVTEWRGFRILLQICYDLRFPVFSRNRGDYDMIIYIANWPQSRIEVWNTLLRARAIENLCYVAGINRTGTDPTAVYNGSSALIDFRGQTVAAAADSGETAFAGTLDIGSLQRFRAKFPALEDADEFQLI